MNPIYLLLALILPIISLYFILYNYKTKTRRSLPPSPPKLPIIGNLHQFGGIPHRTLYSLAEKYGPLFSLQLGGLTGLVVSSPEMAQKILNTHDLIFANRPNFIANNKLTYGLADVAFAPYGDAWKNARKLCVVHLLSSKKVQSLQSMINEEVAEMVSKIKAASSSNFEGGVNLSKIFLSLISDIMCRIVFGRKYSSDDDDVVLKSVLAESQAMFMGFFFGDYLPALWWVDILTGMTGRLEKTFKDMDCFFE